ncbi:MAG: hypothetical protein QW096_10065 [Thermofilaceae archaeon]
MNRSLDKNSSNKLPFNLTTSGYKVKFIVKDHNIHDQVTHPDIIKINRGLRIMSRTYRYIMAMTPYPFYDESYENPYIVVSNNEIEFVEDLIPNPIDPYPGKGYHNSDPDIVYAKGQFFIFWRFRQISTNKSRIFIKKSKDLINWSEKQAIYISRALLSPSVIYDVHENKWKLWGVDEGSWRIMLFESEDGVNWMFVDYTDVPTHINWLGSKRNCWHLDINKTKIGKQYLALIVYASGDGGAPPTFLFFGESEDGIQWKVYREPVLSPYENIHKIYRSTFIIEEGKIKVWYSLSSKGSFLRKLNIKMRGRKVGAGKWSVCFTECDLSNHISEKDTTLNVIA